MIDGLTLGAYVLTPPIVTHDRGAEQGWYDCLSQVPAATGLEVPFRDSIHADGPDRLAELLPPGWHVVVTMLTQTIVQSGRDRTYGLASLHEDGRRAAIADVRSMFAEVEALKRMRGEIVHAVELHSAPKTVRPVNSSSAALAESLREIGEWGWGATTLAVEHCDAVRGDQRPEKGYLELSAESQAVRMVAEESTASIGQSVNWGRSAIEGRAANYAFEQLRAIAARKTLSGIVFSGAPAADSPLGAAWTDLHNALDTDDPSSLLSADDIRRCLLALDESALSNIRFLGVKVNNVNDVASDDFERRLQPLHNVAEVTRRAWAAALWGQGQSVPQTMKAS